MIHWFSAALLGAVGTPPEIRDPVRYDIELRAVVTPPYGTKMLRVWMPVPPDEPGQDVEKSAFTTFPSSVEPVLGTESVHGNTFAYFEFQNPKGAQEVSHRFTVTLSELRWNVDPARVERVEEWPAELQPYLRSESQAVVIDGRVRGIAGELVPRPENAVLDIEQVFGWIDANMRYDHGSASLQASSQWALDQRTGHCSDYHGLCSALTRSLGYPARVAYGLNAFEKASPSHCKTEVYLPPYGWVSFDLSETQKLCGKIAGDAELDEARKEELVTIAKQRLLSGFRDNTWLVQTRGTDYDLAPPASRKVAVVRTIYAEADGVALEEPDPSDASEKKFSWMTLYHVQAERAVPYPFAEISTL